MNNYDQRDCVGYYSANDDLSGPQFQPCDHERGGGFCAFFNQQCVHIAPLFQWEEETKRRNE